MFHLDESINEVFENKGGVEREHEDVAAHVDDTEDVDQDHALDSLQTIL